MKYTVAMVNSTERIRVFICGSALRGQPDNHNLQSAEFLGVTKTAPNYRLHSVENGWHPGIYRTETAGVAIPGEIYALTPEQFGHLEDSEPPHMYPASVDLADGSQAIAFLYPEELIITHNWPDISTYGDWAAYKAATGAEQT